MIATSGFGESYPILVYVYEKSQKEIDFSLGRNLLEDEYHDDKVTLGSTPKKQKSFNRSDYSEGKRSYRGRSDDLSDKGTDLDRDSVYSDALSVSRTGKAEYLDDYNIYRTPERR